MKKFTSITLAALMLMGLAACGDSKSSSSEAATGGATTSQAEEAGNTGAENTGSDFDYSREVTVVSRENGSGTRGAFIELFGIEEKDADGNKIDKTSKEAIETNSTAVMMTTVAGDTYGIGYISLGSLNDTVKALEIDGAAATVENIKSGAYGVSRPFNIATLGGDLSEAAQDFYDFILSAEGQEVVEGAGYIASVENADAFAGGSASGKVVIAGSSSVTPVMQKLVEAYEAVNPNAQIEIQESDSSAGMTSTIDGVCDIGMASRALKDSELDAGLVDTVIAIDGIAVIVNNGNPIDGLASEDVKEIFVSDAISWEGFQG